jgi:hypothetical protein
MASAYSFDTGLSSGIIQGAKWISKNYTTAGQNSLNSMIYGNPNHRYAVNDDGTPNSGWINSIAQIMSTAPKGGGNGGFGEIISNMNRLLDPNCEGGLGELTQTLNDKFTTLMTNEGKLKSERTDFTDPKDNSIIKSVISSNNKDSANQELLKQAIKVLEEIADHTGTTSKDIKELAKKELKVTVANPEQKSSDDKKSDIIVNSDEKNTAINPMIDILNQRQNIKQDKDYEVAKKIAKGRIN